MVDTVVREATGTGGKYRKYIIRTVEGRAVASVLLAHIPQRIGSTTPVRLVDDDKIGEIQHVDLFKLRGCTKFRSHHVHRQVAKIHYLAVPLADPRSFKDHEIKCRRTEDLQKVRNRPGSCEMCTAGSYRSHEHPGPARCVQAYAISQKGAAGAPPGRVNCQQSNRAIGKPVQETSYQFVLKRGLPGTTGTCDTQNWWWRDPDLASKALPQDIQASVPLAGQVLYHCQHAGDLDRVPVRQGFRKPTDIRIVRLTAPRQEVTNHARRTHATAVLDRVHARHTGHMQQFGLLISDGAATAAEDLDS